ncbi:MAG: FAD-dependent monooxygenase [Burkholderiales bacterium]|nr:FAD-dependent monooxygenase [Burkholderiales bacterium]OJX07513.1 MAG: monooxygenase [Burkholderiales bacterium 70-64]
MNVLIVGAGPAGLYLAYLLKRQSPQTALRIVEQNPPDSTFGFGVVFSDRALEFLRDDDPATCELVTPAMQQWNDLVVHHRGQAIAIDGIGFAAIGRLRLLQLLQQQLAGVGIVPEYRRTLTDPRELQGHDLVVAADGVNSFVRRGRESEFGTRIEHLANRFVWYGTTRPFAALSQTFVQAEAGTFNAHHYRYAPDMSTFIVECDPATWERAGFAAMDEAATKAYCERVFAATLDGHPLVTNRSIWRNFPKVWNEHWSAGNTVLIGDALRTAHFSIGSGTRLAFEDAIALARSLREHPRAVADALAAFETARKPVVRKLVAAANASADWYERFPGHMRLEPWELAWQYIQRSGRVDLERLRRVSPRFVAGYEAYAAQRGAAPR